MFCLAIFVWFVFNLHTDIRMKCDPQIKEKNIEDNLVSSKASAIILINQVIIVLSTYLIYQGLLFESCHNSEIQR